MHDPRSADPTPLNAPDVGTEDKLRQLAGEEAHLDQDAFLARDEIDDAGPLSDTEIYEGALEAGAGVGAAPESMSLESLTSTELRAGETGNPDVAAEEGETWVPPIDPPVVADADAPGGVRMAAGFGTTAQDEPFDADHHASALPEDDEVSARVEEALFADARTSRLADQVRIETAGDIVRLRGTVADIEDGELLEAVASEVPGVAEVRDETEIEGL